MPKGLNQQWRVWFKFVPIDPTGAMRAKYSKCLDTRADHCTLDRMAWEFLNDGVTSGNSFIRDHGLLVTHRDDEALIPMVRRNSYSNKTQDRADRM